MDFVEVHMRQPYQTETTEIAKGYLISNNELGVTICADVNGNGKVFYPATRITKIVYTGTRSR